MAKTFRSRRRLRLQWASHRGIRVAYHQEGAGPDLLLIPSPLILATTYMGTVEELSRHFRVTIVELPGSGRSSRLRVPWTFSDYALFMKGICAELNLDRPCVIGHSNTGPIAALMASQFPRTVRGAILADAVGAHPSSHLLAILWGRILDSFLELWLTLTGFPHLLWNFFVHTRNFLFQVRLCGGSPILQKETLGPVPALLAWGRRDHTMPPICMERWATCLPRATKYLSTEGSHDWIITHPEEFTKLTCQYIATLRGSTEVGLNV